MNRLTDAYLDNAATSRPYPEVIQTVCDAMKRDYGNPSSLHAPGRRAKEQLEHSRQVIADALGVDPDEVYFTSGGTESNNLALVGACRAVENERRGIVASALEHPSVTKTVRGLKREGWKVGYVDAFDGDYDLPLLRQLLDEDTAIVTTMRVQNEVGFILPVQDVVAARNELAPKALVHSDAVQAFGKIEFLPRKLGIDLSSFSAHKIGGPRGIGALYVKRGTKMFTTAFGGGQERGLRSGTEALPLIMGFAKAVEITMAHRQEAQENAERLKQRLIGGITQMKPDVRINSRSDGSPYVVSLSLPGVDNRAALDFLSDRGVFVSQASACDTLHPDVPPEDWITKHPLSLHLAGVPKKLVGSTFRVSFSAVSTADEVDRFLRGMQAFLDQGE